MEVDPRVMDQCLPRKAQTASHMIDPPPWPSQFPHNRTQRHIPARNSAQNVAMSGLACRICPCSHVGRGGVLVKMSQATLTRRGRGGDAYFALAMRNVCSESHRPPSACLQKSVDGDKVLADDAVFRRRSGTRDARVVTWSRLQRAKDPRPSNQHAVICIFSLPTLPRGRAREFLRVSQSSPD